MAPRKPIEELYDIKNDPYEINNLADSPQYGRTLEKMRAILQRWIEETGDTGRFPEKPSSITPEDREIIYGQ